MKTLLVAFLFCSYFSFGSSANSAEQTMENNFNIRAGLSLGRMHLKSSLIPENYKKKDSTESTSFGFNTSAGYKWNNWELMLGSDILFGKLKDLTFRVDSTEIRGDGSFRIFSLTPILRFYTPYTIYNRWNFFAGAGPTWSLHTFILNNNLNNTNFSNKKRISFENRGGTLNLGLEEVVPYKETHPTFFEIGYSYMRSKRIFIVDATDFKDAKTLSRGDSKDFYGHYFVFRFGITLF